jgi:hypothetical protein
MPFKTRISIQREWKKRSSDERILNAMTLKAIRDQKFNIGRSLAFLKSKASIGRDNY